MAVVAAAAVVSDVPVLGPVGPLGPLGPASQARACGRVHRAPGSARVSPSISSPNGANGGWARAISGSVGRASCGRPASSVQPAAHRGSRSVRTEKRTTPRLKRSASGPATLSASAGDACRPSALTSGAANPRVYAGARSCPASTTYSVSISRRSPAGVTMTLCGLKSRITNPAS